MSGRQRFRAVCAVKGCTESAYYDGLTVKDRDEMWRRQQREPWLCSRHVEPDEVITPINTARTVVLTAERSKRFPNLGAKLFWREEGREDVGSGFMAGPGFKAWADDFPEGAKLVITVTVTPTLPGVVAAETEAMEEI